MKVELKTLKTERLIIKKCHHCANIMESCEEIKKCTKCKMSFLPSNYFSKVHSKNAADYEHLFASSQELHETDLIKGLTVLW